MTVLRIRDVRLIVGAVGLSAFGDFLLWIPLALHVEAISGSPLAVSGFFLALFGPVVALGGVAGRLADRFENARLLWIASLAQAAVVAVMALTTDSLAAILVLSAALGAGNAIAQPAEFALVPAAAGDDHVGEANGLVETARYAGATGGPLVGGLLAAAGLLEVALLLDAATFAAVALAARLMHARRHPRAAAKVDGDGGRARDGLAYLTADRVLRVTLAGAVAALLFFSMSIAAEVFYVTDVLKAGDAAYGVLMASWTLGMVAGAVGLARRIPPAALAAGALAGIAVQGARHRRRGGVRRAVGRVRGLHARRHRARRQERPAPHADPRARAGRPARPRVRRLQRGAQRRRAGCARRRRRADRRDRRPARAAAVGRDPARDRRRGDDRARLAVGDRARTRVSGRLSGASITPEVGAAPRRAR